MYDFETNGALAIANALNSVTVLSDDDYLDAPEACAALAAVECVVAANNGDTSRLSQDARNVLAEHQSAIKQGNYEPAAKQAIQRISANSELKELWEDADDFQSWQADVHQLIINL